MTTLASLLRCPQCKSADIIKISTNDLVNHQCQNCSATFTEPRVEAGDRALETARKDLARQLVTRITSNALSVFFARQSDIINTEEMADQEMTQADCVDDAIAVLMGDDTGCLGDEDLTPDNIVALWVEEELESAMNAQERELRELKEALRRWPATYDSENRMVMRFTREEWTRLLAERGEGR